MDSTTRLGLQKPNDDPQTGDFLDVNVLNSNADKLDAAVGATPVTSATRPAAPFDGQFIRETDTRRLYVRNNTEGVWEQIATPGPARFRSPFDVERDTAGQTFYNGYLTGEANPRFSVSGTGGINWGPGSAGGDTNLYRGSVGNQLRTDDDFVVGGSLEVIAPPLLIDAVNGTMATATTAEAIARTFASRTYKNGKAYDITLRCQLNAVAALGLVFRLRKGNALTGTLILDYGRIQVTQIGTDVYAYWTGCFRNVTGADITTQLVLTTQTTASTCAIKGFSGGTVDMRIEQLSGTGANYPGAASLT